MPSCRSLPPFYRKQQQMLCTSYHMPCCNYRHYYRLSNSLHCSATISSFTSTVKCLASKRTRGGPRSRWQHLHCSASTATEPFHVLRKHVGTWEAEVRIFDAHLQPKGQQLRYLQYQLAPPTSFLLTLRTGVDSGSITLLGSPEAGAPQRVHFSSADWPGSRFVFEEVMRGSIFFLLLLLPPSSQ